MKIIINIELCNLTKQKREIFNGEDMKFMIFFFHCISGFIELATLYFTEESLRDLLSLDVISKLRYIFTNS